MGAESLVPARDAVRPPHRDRGVVAIESVAGGLFVVVQIAVLGLAAHAYERTASLLVLALALAYPNHLLTSDAVVFVFEAGMQS